MDWLSVSEHGSRCLHLVRGGRLIFGGICCCCVEEVARLPLIHELTTLVFAPHTIAYIGYSVEIGSGVLEMEQRLLFCATRTAQLYCQLVITTITAFNTHRVTKADVAALLSIPATLLLLRLLLSLLLLFLFLWYLFISILMIRLWVCCTA